MNSLLGLILLFVSFGVRAGDAVYVCPETMRQEGLWSIENFEPEIFLRKPNLRSKVEFDRMFLMSTKVDGNSLTLPELQADESSMDRRNEVFEAKWQLPAVHEGYSVACVYKGGGEKYLAQALIGSYEYCEVHSKGGANGLKGVMRCKRRREK